MKYVVRRILALIITMIMVSFLAFAAFHMISGDPAQAILGTNATPERLELLRHELGLDQPFLVQYFRWLTGFFTGNLGISYSYRQPVANLIIPKLKVTLLMVMISFVIIVVCSLPMGLRAAQKSGSRLEWVRTTFQQLCMAVPRARSFRRWRRTMSALRSQGEMTGRRCSKSTSSRIPSSLRSRCWDRPWRRSSAAVSSWNRSSEFPGWEDFSWPPFPTEIIRSSRHLLSFWPSGSSCPEL